MEKRLLVLLIEPPLSELLDHARLLPFLGVDVACEVDVAVVCGLELPLEVVIGEVDLEFLELRLQLHFATFYEGHGILFICVTGG